MHKHILKLRRAKHVVKEVKNSTDMMQFIIFSKVKCPSLKMCYSWKHVFTLAELSEGGFFILFFLFFDDLRKFHHFLKVVLPLGKIHCGT